MGKALLVAHPNVTVQTGTEANLFGFNSTSITESNTEFVCTEDATFSMLGLNISGGGSGTNTCRFRDNGANGNQVAQNTGTGVVEDGVNSDTLTASDVFNLGFTLTGSDLVIAWVKANVEFASGHGCFHGCTSYASGSTFDVASDTRFVGMGGNVPGDGNSVEAEAQWKNRAYTSIAAIQVDCTANARTNNTAFRSRVNGAFGNLQVDFAAGVTGQLTDSSPTDTLADGDLVCVSVTTGTGTEALTVRSMGMTLKSSSGKSEVFAFKNPSAGVVGSSRAASGTATYHPIGGSLELGDTDAEATQRLKPGFAATVGNLRCYVSANTYSGSATLKLYKNGASVITLTINAGATGWQENAVDTVSINDTDELSYELDEGSSGSITLTGVGITFSPPAAGGGRPNVHGKLSNSLLLGGLVR